LSQVGGSFHVRKTADRIVSERKFITGQNEREESTQNTTVTKSAEFASYHGHGHGHGLFIKYKSANFSIQTVKSTCSEPQRHAVY
jgi:hypothetical protein